MNTYCFLFFVCFLLYLCIDSFEFLDATEPSTTSSNQKQTQLINKPTNSLRTLQTEIDRSVQSSINPTKVRKTPQCYSSFNNTANVILGYDPSIAYIVDRQNNFVSVKLHEKHKNSPKNTCTKPGFTYRNGKCQENQCTCSNGTPAQGTDCHTHGATNCIECNEGYRIRSDKAVCEKNICQCMNGTPFIGKGCFTNGLERCKQCERGFHLENGRCIPNLSKSL